MMRLSIGLPGENRQDREVTDKVKASEHLGDKSGKWIKNLFPSEALAPLKKLDGEARAYHSAVTFPFDAGVGILPAALILEYADRMRDFASKRRNLVQSHFAAKYPEFIEWARKEHNGSFDASLYPPVEEILEKFYFKTEPLPVPDALHFESTVASLLGTDTDSVNARVAEASKETQRELLKRMMEPLRAMATKLAEQPKEGKDCPIFRDTLVSNLAEIVALAPKMNLTGDPEIDAFAAAMKPLTEVTPQQLRENVSVRGHAANMAASILKNLEGYSL